MKKFILIFFFLSMFLNGNSQFYSDLIVYNPLGDVFSVYLENSRVNNYPSNKIRVNDLQNGNYNISIVFKNKSIPSINQTIYINKNSEIACVISRTNNGRYFINIFYPIIYTDVIDNEFSNDNQNQFSDDVFCNYPMEDNAFSSALNSIKEKDFDSDKLLIAKQIAESNCLLSLQIKQIIETFSFESNKLKFAKFAYNYTYDPNNYFFVNDAFDFSSSIKKLSDYISNLNYNK